MSESTGDPQSESRAEHKRRLIVEAATTVFLEHGYVAASMDQIAALAAVSKQTVYKHFTDKEALFAEIVRATAARADDLDGVAQLALADSGDLADDLGQLARALITVVVRPEVRRVRRLVTGEAGRFPDLGRGWYLQAFERGMATLASCFEELHTRGALRIDDPVTAANHFAGLVLWVPVNRVMFCGDDERVDDEEIERVAARGVRSFLAAYGAPET